MRHGENVQLHGPDCRDPHTLHPNDDHQRVALQNGSGSKTAWGKSDASPSPQDGDAWEYLGPGDVIFGPYTLHHLQRWLQQRFLMADQQVGLGGTCCLACEQHLGSPGGM